MATEPGGNTRLRSARQALGLRSQRQLAEAVTRAGAGIGLRISINERTVRRWESEAPPWPSPGHQAALEHLFGRPLNELGFVPPWAGEAADASRERLSPGASMPNPPGGPSVFPRRKVSNPLPGSVVTDYITITATYRHMYWTVPPTQLHDAVSSHVKLGLMLFSSTSDAASRALADSVAESSLLAGRIEFFDMQDAVQAQHSLVIALQAAQEARDSLIGAAILAHMAFMPAFSGDKKRAEEARDKIRAARTFARRASAPPDMLSWLDAVEAEVETRFGDTRKALQLIHDAEERFTTESPRPSPAWLDWFSPVRLAGFKGNTLLVDHQLGPAKATLQAVLDDIPEDAAKQRSVILGDLASVSVAEGKPEEACQLAEMALEQLGRTWYATGMSRVRSVRESLQQWESLPCVRRLDERLYDWSTAVNAVTS